MTEMSPDCFAQPSLPRPGRASKASSAHRADSAGIGPDGLTACALIVLLLALAVCVVGAKAAVGPPPRIAHAIRLASVTYGADYGEMVAVARCETGGTFNPRARNASSSASGLFQFLTSTWARTPYRNFSVYDAHANALAAAWLWRHDGGSWREWECSP